MRRGRTVVNQVWMTDWIIDGWRGKATTGPFHSIPTRARSAPSLGKKPGPQSITNLRLDTCTSPSKRKGIQVGNRFQGTLIVVPGSYQLPSFTHPGKQFGDGEIQKKRTCEQGKKMQ